MEQSLGRFIGDEDSGNEVYAKKGVYRRAGYMILKVAVFGFFAYTSIVGPCIGHLEEGKLEAEVQDGTVESIE